MESFDTVILGAGCAGLSLASRVSPPGTGLVLDPREGFSADRTWCFFSRAPFGFDDAISHRWSAWKVRLDGRELVMRAPGVDYVHVASERFYDVARARIARAGVFDVRLGVAAKSVRVARDGAVVETSAGPVRARRVFDTRPPKLSGPVPRGEVRLLQHFKGVVVDVGRDAFDPEVATLMDFDVSQADGTAFVYVLPMSPRRALIEATWFSPSVLPEARYDAVIREWLRTRVGVTMWEEVRAERGVLPMTTEPLARQAPEGVVPIGLAGDLAKPSTGYAFLAIQRQSSAIAARLAAGATALHVPPRPQRTLAVDRVFLTWLARHPSRGAALLFSLFERVPAEVLVRFLSDEASPSDDLAVMRAVPPLSFGLATARALPGWLRAF